MLRFQLVPVLLLCLSLSFADASPHRKRAACRPPQSLSSSNVDATTIPHTTAVHPTTTAAPSKAPTTKATLTTSKTTAPVATTTPNSGSSGSSGSSSSGSSGSSSGSGSVSASDIQQYLDIHNTERSKYGAQAMVWNNTLEAAAQKWANNCQFHHSGGSLGPFGENLAAGTGAYAIADGLQGWMDEAPQYSSSNPQPSHWTQMVWKSSTNLGCAVATCDNIFDFATYGASQFYVCEYWPQGNFLGEFPQNVQ